MNSRTGTGNKYYKARCDCILGPRNCGEILPFWGPYLCGVPVTSFGEDPRRASIQVYYPKASQPAGAVDPQYVNPMPEPEGYMSETLWGHYSA